MDQAVRAGIELLHVPYRAAPRNGLISAQVQLCFEPTALAITLTRGPEARLRALAVLGTGPELPGVPLLSETYPGFVVRILHGLWGPPGMAPEAVAQMRAAVADRASVPWLRERMALLATRLIGEGPAALDTDGTRPGPVVPHPARARHPA
jgi:tripartite-type tricarboxylate transporter receptor subunit TctC